VEDDEELHAKTRRRNPDSVFSAAPREILFGTTEGM
jgi:hypothetical protein